MKLSTKRERDLVETLLEAACGYIAGAGCGLRSVPTPERRQEILNAIGDAYESLYGEKMTINDLRNRGVSL